MVEFRSWMSFLPCSVPPCEKTDPEADVPPLSLAILIGGLVGARLKQYHANVVYNLLNKSQTKRLDAYIMTSEDWGIWRVMVT